MRERTTAGTVDRVVAAPISWGVCEVPGWGHVLPAERVLAEMRDLGLRSTELGPAGYLPTDPGRLRDLLDQYRLTLAAAFVPVVLHDASRHDEQLAEVGRAARQVAQAGGQVLVLAASTGRSDYEATVALDDEDWATLASTVDECAAVAAEHGLASALHPHVGTVVEGVAAVRQVLERSEVGLCVDTGHLMAGGVDPLELVREVPERVRHVHLKDVAAPLAREVREGRTSYEEAVRRGLYRPLGDGDVPVAEVVATLEQAGYGGSYVLEQDCMLDDDPPAGHGPVRDVARCLEFLRTLLDGRT